MKYKVYVKRLHVCELKTYNENKFIRNFNGYQKYAEMSSLDNVSIMTQHMYCRAKSLNVSADYVIVGNRVYFTFFSAVLNINDILYDPFTPVESTIYMDNLDKPDIFYDVGCGNGQLALFITARKLTEYTGTIGIEVFGEDLLYINLLKTSLEKEKCKLVVKLLKPNVYHVTVFTDMNHTAFIQMIDDIISKLHVEFTQENGEILFVFENHNDFHTSNRVSESKCRIRSTDPKFDFELFNRLIYRSYDWYEGRGPIPPNMFLTCTGTEKEIDGVYTNTIEVYNGRCPCQPFDVYHERVMKDCAIMRDVHKYLKEFSDIKTFILNIPYIRGVVCIKIDNGYNVLFGFEDDYDAVKRLTNIFEVINACDESFKFQISTVSSHVRSSSKEEPIQEINFYSNFNDSETVNE